MENKKVIYTCITGGYDKLEDPKVISEGFDYICFTDIPFESEIWQMRSIPSELDYLSNVKKQRNIKINPHKYLSEYDFSVWIDGSITIKGDVNLYIEKYCKEDDVSIYIPKHPARNCIYEESKAVIRLKKDTKENVNKQISIYAKEGFPKNYGLVQSGIIFRYHNNEDCIRLMEAWWKEVEQYSHRDQLSFNYVLWKNPDIKIVYLDKNLFNSEYFKWSGSHKGKKNSATKVSKTRVVKNNTLKHMAPSHTGKRKQITFMNSSW